MTMIKVTNLSTYDEFMQLMLNLRTIRRGLVESMKTGKILIDSQQIVDSFRNAETCLTKTLKNAETFESTFTMDGTGKANQSFKFNIKDELLGVRKDLHFLDAFFRNRDLDESALIDALSQYHPIGPERFLKESRDLIEKLKAYCAARDGQNADDVINGQDCRLLDYFITDWDGTYKTYCSNYATCMQPAYSGVILVKFLEYWCKFIAVLTAGPLRGPGILDLMSLTPRDGVNVGGSWGREWLLASTGHNDVTDAHGRLVDKSCFSPENEPLFERLTKGITELLKREEFLSFSHVGSGFQRKVDRVTLAVQNVSGDVSKEASEKYVAALEKLMSDIDPSGHVFHMDKAHLDVEIVIKHSTSKQPWSKSDGLNLLQSHLNLSFDRRHSKILLCGDTASDLPMLEYFQAKNIQPFVVFVNPAPEVTQLLQKMTSDPERLCLVGCPEVIHAAMLTLIKERRTSSHANSHHF